jgi:hypothetical protein
VLLITPTASSAQTRDIAGVITELKPGHGVVEIQTAGAAGWRPAAPLAALRGGDTVRVTEDAFVVVLLGGGRGSRRVEAATSPFSVPALPAGETALRKGAALLQKSLGSLSSSRQDPTYVKMGIRGIGQPPVVLSPRDGPILPGEVEVEWAGIRERRYIITVIDPKGVQVQRASLQGLTYTYPADAPALSPGLRYRVQVTTGNLRPEEVWFEILDSARSAAALQDLADVEQAAGSEVSKPTLAALQATVLADQNLLSDARRTVLTALKSDPEEPSLHLLLGTLYKRMGLAEQAAESFEEAALLSRGPRR